MRDVVLCEGSLGVVIPFNCDKCGGLIEQREQAYVRVFADNTVEHLCERCFTKRTKNRIKKRMDETISKGFESLDDLKVAVFDTLCALFPGEATDVLDEKAMRIVVGVMQKLGNSSLSGLFIHLHKMVEDGDVVVLSPDNPEQIHEALKRIFGGK